MPSNALLAEIQEAVEAAATEAGERRAIDKILARAGHYAAPDITTTRSADGRKVRVYAYRGTPAGDFDLVTGPDAKGAIGLPSRANPTVKPTSTEIVSGLRSNSTKGPQAADIGKLSSYPAGGTGPKYVAELSDVLIATDPTSKWAKEGSKQITKAIGAAIMRFYLKTLKLAPPLTVKVHDTYLADFDVRLPYGVPPLTSAQEAAFKTAFPNEHSLHPGGLDISVDWSHSGGQKWDPDPGADYAYQGAGGWRVPAEHVNYVAALIASAAKANGLKLTDAGQLALASKPSGGKSAGSTTSGGHLDAEDGVIEITWNDTDGLTVSGDTYPVKDIIKEHGFKWGKWQKLWYYPNSKAWSNEWRAAAQVLHQALKDAGANAINYLEAQSVGEASETGLEGPSEWSALIGTKPTGGILTQLPIGTIGYWTDDPGVPNYFFQLASLEEPRWTQMTSTGLAAGAQGSGDLSKSLVILTIGEGKVILGTEFQALALANGWHVKDDEEIEVPAALLGHGKADESTPSEGMPSDDGDPPVVFKDTASFGPDGRWEHGVQYVASKLHVQPGTQKGSNPGGLAETPNGEKFYVKFPKDLPHAANEVLAAQLYRQMYVYAPDVRWGYVNGKVAVISPWSEGYEPAIQEFAAGIGPLLAETFAADCWLANWDVVGLVYDNLLVRPKDVGLSAGLLRVDTGGALLFRAQGAPKGSAFTADSVPEVTTLLDPKMNAQSASIFGPALKAHYAEFKGFIEEHFGNIAPGDLHKLALWAGFDDATAKQLAKTLNGRAARLMELVD